MLSIFDSTSGCRTTALNANTRRQSTNEARRTSVGFWESSRVPLSEWAGDALFIEKVFVRSLRDKTPLLTVFVYHQPCAQCHKCSARLSGDSERRIHTRHRVVELHW